MNTDELWTITPMMESSSISLEIHSELDANDCDELARKLQSVARHLAGETSESAVNPFDATS